MNTKTLRRQTKFVPLDGSPTTLKAVKKGRGECRNHYPIPAIFIYHTQREK